MSVLASLVGAYERLEKRGEVPPYGFSRVAAAFCVVIDLDGRPAFDPIDRREPVGRKLVAPRINLPSPLGQRTSGIQSNFLWDKTAYSLGVTNGSGERTQREHLDFKSFNLDLLKDAKSQELIAFCRFIERWEPSNFSKLGWPIEMVDENIVFAIKDSYKDGFISSSNESCEIWLNYLSKEDASISVCLVSGERSRIARSHPPIKNVWNAQSSGAFVVSYNKPSFVSYDHREGDNAPVSEVAAFAYTSALNRFLEKGSPNRIQIGDASTVFWADARDAEDAQEAEDLFAQMLGETRVDEGSEAKKVGAVLAAIREGRPLADAAPNLAEGVRFFVLGLAPNAARLSVRFFLEDDFGRIGEHYIAHLERMRIEPPAKEPLPSMWRLLIETATLRKSENIAPDLAGEWLRAILSGTDYPLTLMSSLITRMRADHDVNAHRVGILKSVLLKNFGKEVPVALDKDERDSGYLLGRLFAAYEYAQTQALPGLNATIRDKYYGTASASPRAVFPLLQRSATHHLAKLRKEKPGLANVLDRRIGEIFEAADPRALFVPTLNAARQSMFAVGYYHQKNDFYRPRSDATADPASQETH